MPIFESTCIQPQCSINGKHWERLAKSYEAYITDVPACPECGARMEPVVSAPNVCWARTLGDYSDKRIAEQQGQKIEDGHWVERVRSNRNRDGSKDREYITTRAQQLKFIKEEGLEDPLDMQTVEATPDGLRPTTTQGNKGSWI